MSRVICSRCERPEKVCLCDWITPINNRVQLGILQHPSEVSQVKGTAKIAQLSLKHCHTWVGESLTDLPGLVTWLKDGKHVFLLYPELNDQCEPITLATAQDIQAQYPLDEIKLLVLDGTWRKTHKIMMLNSVLRGLDRLVLTPRVKSMYRIRKQKNPASLSTVEAIYEALSQLEGSEVIYQPLLSCFEAMQQQQMAFRQTPSND